jgi:hypothetical protein
MTLVGNLYKPKPNLKAYEASELLERDRPHRQDSTFGIWH